LFSWYDDSAKLETMNSNLPRIFIVDDDRSFGNSLVRLLRTRGFFAEHFSSAQCFLDSTLPDQRGIVIIDIHMPVCNGFMLCEKMKQQHYDMPVIFVTGQAQTDDRDLALNKGAIGFLLKPFSEESLLELLQ
jgi:FixJ family two-component response regulator